MDIYAILCVFFGWLGLHKFYRKQYIIGILYACTLGCFGIGWIYDVVMLLKSKTTNTTTETSTESTVSKLTAQNQNLDTVKEILSNKTISFGETTSTRRYSLNGCYFDNEDGTNRQQLIQTLKETTTDLKFYVHQYENQPAIALTTIDNHIVGFIAKATLVTFIEFLMENPDTNFQYVFSEKETKKGKHDNIKILAIK